jgi:diguanylate cyclase (GGDEF)-like protein
MQTLRTGFPRIDSAGWYVFGGAIAEETAVLEPAASSALALDMSTLLVVAICVTALLGLFLLFAWMQERVRALAWWGAAYLIGGLSVALWSVENLISPPLPPGTANALLFVSCGMIWSAARLFHGRPILWGSMALGATIWLVSCMSSDFVGSAAARITLSSLIVSGYTFMTALELWRERRKHLLRRWLAIFVPILHGAVFLMPIPLASVLPADGGVLNLASGWVAVFVLETMLYLIGTAFIMLLITKERMVRIHKAAALTDTMTGLFNRRGFVEAAHQLMARQAKRGEPVSVLMFDLDHFKSINDSFGHAVGDDALRLFASIIGTTMRANDVIARFGGEEFVAMLPGTMTEAVGAAERVRLAFEAAALEMEEGRLGATVSIGVASGQPGADIDTLIGNADAALYRAKLSGRNRVEQADEDGKLTLLQMASRAAA